MAEVPSACAAGTWIPEQDGRGTTRPNSLTVGELPVVRTEVRRRLSLRLHLRVATDRREHLQSADATRLLGGTGGGPAVETVTAGWAAAFLTAVAMYFQISSHLLNR